MKKIAAFCLVIMFLTIPRVSHGTMGNTAKKRAIVSGMVGGLLGAASLASFYAKYRLLQTLKTNRLIIKLR